MTGQYGILEGSIIVKQCCGDIPDDPNVVVLPDDWPGVVPCDIRFFTPDLHKSRSADELVAMGLLTLRPEEKIERGEVVAKNFFERIRDGIDQAPPGQKLVISAEGVMSLQAMTYDEEIAAGKMTKQTATLLKATEARARRNAELDRSDWTQGNDAELTEEQRSAWKSYRAFLRRVPEQPGFPDNIDWGTPPDGIQA